MCPRYFFCVRLKYWLLLTSEPTLALCWHGLACLRVCLQEAAELASCAQTCSTGWSPSSSPYCSSPFFPRASSPRFPHWRLTLTPLGTCGLSWCGAGCHWPQAHQSKVCLDCCVLFRCGQYHKFLWFAFLTNERRCFSGVTKDKWKTVCPR